MAGGATSEYCDHAGIVLDVWTPYAAEGILKRENPSLQLLSECVH